MDDWVDLFFGVVCVIGFIAFALIVLNSGI